MTITVYVIRSWMDGNIVENITKYCQTAKIAVVFIHKTCSKVKSILQTASLVLIYLAIYLVRPYQGSIVAFKVANLLLDISDYSVI